MSQYMLPELSYDFSALEPVISGQIMELHYTKHHRGYVTQLNLALEKYEEANRKQNLSEMISLQPVLRFNGGGHINHSIFWSHLAPVGKGGGESPTGKLVEQIQLQFGSLDLLIEQLSKRAVAIMGSGWAWLGWDPLSKQLILATCPNQDPLSTLGYVPLLGIDVWEHAYYLQYQNVRADYVKNIWNVIDWRSVEKRFLQAF